MPESGAKVVVVEARTTRTTHRPGFTIIDVLVTMAVIAILISLLSPSLSSVRESARQVVCRSNVLQIGIGISIFARDNRDHMIPPSINSPIAGGADPWQTMSLRLMTPTPGEPEGWDGLGRLYQEDILPTPKLFYCPSHRGEHPFVEQIGLWSGRPGEIVGNFQYRAAGLLTGPTPQAPYGQFTTRYEVMRPGSALVADGMRTQSDFNHGVGANVLRAGLSVDWFPDKSGSFLDQLPRDGQIPSPQAALNAWLQLDESHP